MLQYIASRYKYASLPAPLLGAQPLSPGITVWEQRQGEIESSGSLLDNAISAEAARIKGIASPVAGDPDILLVPDLEAGNMLAKQLTFLANADSAGLVVGARVPIVLTSRADSVRSRIASCAVAMLAAHGRRQPLQVTT